MDLSPIFYSPGTLDGAVSDVDAIFTVAARTGWPAALDEAELLNDALASAHALSKRRTPRRNRTRQKRRLCMGTGE